MKKASLFLCLSLFSLGLQAGWVKDFLLVGCTAPVMYVLAKADLRPEWETVSWKMHRFDNFTLESVEEEEQINREGKKRFIYRSRGEFGYSWNLTRDKKIGVGAALKTVCGLAPWERLSLKGCPNNGRLISSIKRKMLMDEHGKRSYFYRVCKKNGQTRVFKKNKRLSAKQVQDLLLKKGDNK